jgi:DNA-directed RNA polymerase II subunit RPB1
MFGFSKYYNENVKTVKNISFNLWGNKKVKLYSAVKNDSFGINLPYSYDNFEPKKGGLVDLRLGTCDIYLNCSTCGLNSNECQGHFGHTDLAEPVYHFGFLNHNVNTLKCVCFYCSKLLIELTPEIINKFKNKTSKQRHKEIKEITKNINFCHHCGSPVPKIRKEVNYKNASIKIVIENEVKTTQEDGTTLSRNVKEDLSARKCYNILRNISDVDAYILGFDSKKYRPEDMIIYIMPIPPVSIRPSAKINFMSSATREDSLTLKIAEVLNSNSRVRNEMNKEKGNIEDAQTLLQYHVATYFDNNSTSLPTSEFKTGGLPIKSISDRIKGKEGRVRNNVMGKRVDFSGRSVITSDPNINIDEIGVPLKMAKILTIPEEVTPRNIEHLTILVKRGPTNYPGANYVTKIVYINGKPVEQKIDLSFRKGNIKLSYGDIVDRQIINGDYILFNRQPTLHKPSMMGHKVHVLNRDDSNTFRMNVSVTEPYNADFDGDEMNLHLGQTIQARNELEYIANVKYQIIGAKDSNPIIGCVQDAVAGAYLLSLDKNISKDLVSNILSITNSKSQFNIDKSKNYTGKQLFSHIIPEGINSKKSGFQIKNGELIEGKLGKTELSKKKNSIIHYVWDKYGPKETKDFIDNSQRIVLYYLLSKGLTIGFKDTILDKEMDKKIINLVDTSILSAKNKLTMFENDKENYNPELLEELQKAELNSISSNIGKMLLDVLDNDNGLKILVSSGSKGSAINIAQMSGCLGQVVVEGQRIKKRVNNRTLPLFHQNDDTPKARGFVSSNFLDGLKCHEFYFHVMAGREGLIDTALKTAETGYIQRKIVKSLEDLIVRYDGIVRNGHGNIIQFLYGENGIDQIKQTQVKFNIINMNNNDIKKELIFTDSELKKVKGKNVKELNEKLMKEYFKMRNMLRKIYFVSTSNYKVIEDSFYCPINYNRLIQEYSKGNVNTELEPDYIIKKIDEVLNDSDNRLIVLNNEKLFGKLKLLNEDETNFKMLLKFSLYEYLSPKKCIFKYGLSKSDFDNLISDIKLSLTRGIIEPGENVGVIAAQSIGEPTSQMTLNTKHSAGVASKSSANMGVPRIKEILNFSRSIKSPQMKIYFDKSINTNKSSVNIISSYFTHLTIKDLINKAEIYYLLNKDDEINKIIKNDKVSNPFFINNQKIDLDLLPFVFRITVNDEKMLDKETSLLDIKTKFITYWYKNFSNVKTIKKNLKNIITKIDKLAILSNNDNVIHIRFKLIDFTYSTVTEFLKIVFDEITLKGIDSINDIELTHERQITFDDEGNTNVDKEYVLTSLGINLPQINEIKNLDKQRIKINDIGIVYKYYGIEAARKVILDELIFTYGAGGSSVNYTHLSLLTDFMTHIGEIISVDRHGLNKVNVDPMARASFEKIMEYFTNAALFNEVDTMKSISSRIMVGRVIPGGTGAFDLLLDTDKIKNSEYIEDETSGRTQYVPIEKDNIFEDIISNELTDMNFFIPN